MIEWLTRLFDNRTFMRINAVFGFLFLGLVLCQEKVQVKSELFLQPSIFYPANLSILFNFCSYTFSYSFGDRYPQ